MNLLEQALAALTSDLSDLRIRFALIGGLAVGIRTEPRFTRDADLVVSVADDRAAEHLVRDLTLRGYRPITVLEQDAQKRLSTVRLAPRTETLQGLLLDLLFASSGIEPEIVRDADVVEVMAGLRMPVASTGHLIALKLLSRDDDQRPQDLIDLKALIRTASAHDIAVARDAVELITQRGFSRGRDLVHDVDELLPR